MFLSLDRKNPAALAVFKPNHFWSEMVLCKSKNYLDFVHIFMKFKKEVAASKLFRWCELKSIT